MSRKRSLQRVETTEKTLELLELLAAGNEDLHIGELADKLRLSRNEVLLLLVTLENRGMARWDALAKVYRAGWKSAELAHQFLKLSNDWEESPAQKASQRQGTRARVRRLSTHC